MKKTILFFTLIFMINFYGYTGSGVVVNTLYKPYKNGKAVESAENTLYFSGNKLRIDNVHEQRSMIYLGEKDVCIMINNKKQEYNLMTKEDLQEMKKQMQKMQSTMKNLPPEQKKMMKKMMNKKGMDSDFEEPEFKKISSGNKVKKWTCDKYEANRKSQTVAGYWLADFSTLDVKKEDFKAFRGLTAFFQEFVSSLPGTFHNQTAYGAQVFYGDNNPAFRKGFPVKTVYYEKGKKRGESILKNIENKNIDESKFTAPKGYKKVDPSMNMKRR